MCMMREPKNEDRLCEAVMRLVVADRNEAIVKVERVDAVVRDRPAVEAIYHTPTARFAVEHTRIESFPNQIAEGKVFVRLLGPLEQELEGRLPGWFDLIVDVGAARSPADQHAAIRRALSQWIVAQAPALEPEERVGRAGRCDITATPPGVPFAVTLHRDCDYESELHIAQCVVGDLQAMRRERIGQALDRKCPKLAAMREKGCAIVLIFEFNDISLGNRWKIADATVEELAGRADAPDIVFVARTSTRPWKGAFIKNGDALYPGTAPAPLRVLD